MDGKEVAEDASAALGGLTTGGDSLSGCVAFGDGSEELQLNGRFDGFGLLVGVYGFEEAFRRGWLLRRIGRCRHFRSSGEERSVCHRHDFATDKFQQQQVHSYLRV